MLRLHLVNGKILNNLHRLIHHRVVDSETRQRIIHQLFIQLFGRGRVQKDLGGLVHGVFNTLPKEGLGAVEGVHMPLREEASEVSVAADFLGGVVSRES